MPMNLRTAPALSLVVLLLAGCASTGPAPVEDLSLGGPRQPPADRPATRPLQDAGRYSVQRGDTLYSIAFRHGVDYRELAQWNGIAAPYTIYVGQELRLANAPRVASAPASAPRPSTPVAHAATPSSAGLRPPSPSPPMPTPFEPVSAGSTSTPTHAPAGEVVAAGPSTATPAPPTASAPVADAPPKAAVASVPSTTPPVPPSSSEPVANGEVSWRWPADGQVVGTYLAGDQTRQGIDIAGQAGNPVRAAADGAVVYSGNGLVGYGELIIIKHSPNFLSAYGHNRKRLVKEGDRVKAGQLIAEMGSSSASRDTLHIEIRRNGKPANPIDYLPRR
jgi:lipoprotein NlpD